jgi:hypothetical protein
LCGRMLLIVIALILKRGLRLCLKADRCISGSGICKTKGTGKERRIGLTGLFTRGSGSMTRRVGKGV